MDIQSITIRKAGKEDIDSLSEIEMRCFSVPWSREEIAKELEGEGTAAFLVAVGPEGDILGSVSAWFLPPWEVQVGNFAVLPEYRRRGIGAKLMDALLGEARARGIEDISLEVRPSNRAALALYEKYGFKEEGRRKGYYQGKEDAIIMWRRGPVKEWKGLETLSGGSDAPDQG